MSGRPWRSRAISLYRASLRLYPPDFRELYGDAMVQAAADAWDHRRRSVGTAAAVRTWLAMLLESIAYGFVEQVLPAEAEPSFESPRYTEGGAMESLARDLRYAVRGLVRRPAFALTAAATLAVAIGFNATLFGVVRGVLLDPLPYPDSERLLVLRESHAEQGVQGVAVPTYLDWRDRVGSLEAMAAYEYWGFAYTGGEDPVEVPSVKATPSLFRVLGVEPALGRAFSDSEGVPGRDKVVVVSHEFWQAELGGSPDALGRVLELDAEPFEVVGVMPPGFEFPPDEDIGIWSSLAFDPTDDHTANRNARSYHAVARMREDARLDEVRRELERVAAVIAAEHPQSNSGWSALATNAHDQLVGGVRPMLLVLFGAVGVLLVIACANLANLTLAHLAGRQREIAIRTGLGAGRRQLLRQLLAESALLSAAGGGAGLLLAGAGLGWVRGFSTEVLPRVGRIELDAGVVVFTAALCFATALAFGLAPAMKASGASAAEHLRTRSAAPLASQRLFGSLAVCQVALALALTVGAGLMASSFVRLSRVDPGFQPEGVLAANLFLPRAKYGEPHEKKAFYDRMLGELAAAPGVDSVGAVSALPMDEVGINFDLPFAIEGRAPAAPGEEPQADFRVATPGYFETLGIALVRGRLFDESDREGAPRVMLINQTMERRYFPEGGAVGRRVRIPMGGWHEVVGVVADLKHYGLANETRPETYVAFAQMPFGGMTVAVRTSGNPAHLTGLVNDAALAADPAQAVYRFGTLESLIDGVLFVPRLQMVILALFAACSCLLAGVGLYGVMASTVAERTREIGIRLALGARADEVMWMVVRRGMTLAGLGIGVGLALSAGLTRLVEAMLFEVDPLDPWVLAVVSAGFVLVALAANLMPAARAMRVDPVVTLASEL